MIPLTNEISNKFRNLSILCAFFVVIIHCRVSFPQGNVAWYLKEFLENGICEMAVPFFFLASGFFVSAKLEIITWGGYKTELWRRVKTLILPYFFWLLFYEVFMMIIQHKFYLPSYGEWGGDAFSCPFLTPLWYVRALMVLVVLSPMILFMLQRYPQIVLVTLWLIYALLCPYFPLPFWDRLNVLFRLGPLPVLGLFYFTLGMAWRLELVSFPKVRGGGVVGTGILLMLARAFLLDIDYGWTAAYCGFFGVPCLIYGMWQLIPGKLGPTWLVTCSFPIYVMHKFFYPIYHKIFPPVEGCWTYALLVFFVFFCSIATTHLVRKVMPRVARTAFAGR